MRVPTATPAPDQESIDIEVEMVGYGAQGVFRHRGYFVLALQLGDEARRLADQLRKRAQANVFLLTSGADQSTEFGGHGRNVKRSLNNMRPGRLLAWSSCTTVGR